MKRTMSLQDQIWSAHRDQLHRFIRKRIDDTSAAEDLLQDVLAKAYGQLDRLREQGKLLPWLYQITRNALSDYYRRNKLAPKMDDASTVQNSENEEAAQRELSSCVLPFIQQLPPAYRQAIMLSEIEGLTQREVAQQQGLSLSGAKSRVQRGRQMLKTMFLECCRIEQDRRGGVIAFEPKTRCETCE